MLALSGAGIDNTYSGARSEKNEELQTFINGGYKRGDSVVRCVGKDHKPVRFVTYCPVMMAGIDNGHLPDTVVSRSITIRLKAKKSSERVEEFDR